MIYFKLLSLHSVVDTEKSYKMLQSGQKFGIFLPSPEYRTITLPLHSLLDSDGNISLKVTAWQNGPDTQPSFLPSGIGDKADQVQGNH
jgi:hypothetical protein